MTHNKTVIPYITLFFNKTPPKYYVKAYKQKMSSQFNLLINQIHQIHQTKSSQIFQWLTLSINYNTVQMYPKKEYKEKGLKCVDFLECNPL